MSKQKKTSTRSSRQPTARRSVPPPRRNPTAGRPQVQKTLFDLDQGKSK
jgi:hypothetical protein